MCLLPQFLSLFTLSQSPPLHTSPSPQGWRAADFLTWVSRDDYSEIKLGEKKPYETEPIIIQVTRKGTKGH